MSTLEDYKGQTPAWCTGCGNFSILKTFKDAYVELGLEPHMFTTVSGIGQADSTAFMGGHCPSPQG
jgi:2-oxoglutarate ferredoxin oxidoreductase subunit beta